MGITHFLCHCPDQPGVVSYSPGCRHLTFALCSNEHWIQDNILGETTDWVNWNVAQLFDWQKKKQPKSQLQKERKMGFKKHDIGLALFQSE